MSPTVGSHHRTIDVASRPTTLVGILPGLTGLRAIAVILVVLGHLMFARYPTGFGDYALDFAAAGVQLFFVLSGFLITTLLVRERERTGTISLRRFYARRVLRIFPPFYMFLVVTVLMGTVGLAVVPARELLEAALFISNYAHFHTATLGHTWSLAVEEHFYLLFPAMFVLLNRRALIRVCVIGVLVSPFVRMGSYVLFPGQRGIATFQTHNRLDALLLGCLLSLCWDSPLVQRMLRLTRLPLFGVGVVAVLLASVAAENRWRGEFMFPVGHSLQAIVFAAVVGGLQLGPSLARSLLDCRLLVHLGTISYAVYLWQQMFTLAGGGHWWSATGPWWMAIPIALVGPFLLAEISYRLIERPVASVRRKLR